MRPSFDDKQLKNKKLGRVFLHFAESPLSYPPQRKKKKKKAKGWRRRKNSKEKQSGLRIFFSFTR